MLQITKLKGLAAAARAAVQQVLHRVAAAAAAVLNIEKLRMYLLRLVNKLLTQSGLVVQRPALLQMGKRAVTPLLIRILL
jgi:hypothetical protein